MPRAIQSTFFEPLIHGLDVMLAKAEQVITGEQTESKRDTLAVSHRRDLVNLPGVAEQIAAQHEEDADARSLHLFVDVAPDALVVGDSFELHRLVEQLVVSTLETTPSGGCVTISGVIGAGAVTLTFSSHSSSIPFPGVTLLPHDVGEILRAHGGRLKVSNRSENGPRFVVRLPVG